MTITGLLKTTPISSCPAPTSVRTVSFPAGLGAGDPYADGCRMHAALAGRRDSTLSPVVGVVRREIGKVAGGARLRSERRLRSWAGVPGGRADLVAEGPSGSCGIIEIKVVAELPDEPRGRDAAQLGGYVRLQCHWSRQLRRAWASLIYIDLAEGKLRIFDFRGRELVTLVSGAVEVLAAA